MERVECHLRGWLTHGLGSDAAHHLTRVHNCALEYFFDRANQLVERCLVEAIFANDLFRAKIAPQEDFEQPRGVVMRLGDNAVRVSNSQTRLWQDA